MSRTSNKNDLTDTDLVPKLMKIGSVVGVLALVICVFGLFAGWFSISGTSEKDQVGIKVAVNTDEVTETMNAIGSVAKEAKHDAEIVAETDTIEGKVVKLNSADKRGVVDAVIRSTTPSKNDSKQDDNAKPREVAVKMNEFTEIDGTKKKLSELQQGDQVTVFFKQSDENTKSPTNFAIKTTVHENEEK